MKKILYLLFLAINSIYSQVSFDNAEILLDNTHFSSDISALISADLNNDGYKEIIVGSYYDNKILFYKNIQGDIQYNERQIITQNPLTNYYSNFGIYCSDLDNDGLLDIIVSHDALDKVSWFKNLGNFMFGTENIISASIDKPLSVIADDIDNDGDNDVLVGSYNDENVSLFLNNGNATFSNPIIVVNTNNEVNEVKLIDIDKNGFLDIFSAHRDGSIYLTINNGSANFSAPEHVVGDASGSKFGFLDLDADNYFDLVYLSTSNNSINYSKYHNLYGFTTSRTINNSISEPADLAIKDIDNDGLDDIIVSTQYEDKIGWLKKTSQYAAIFSSLSEISIEVKNPFHILVEDLDNDNTPEIISSSYEPNVSKNQKLSIFEYNNTTNIYNEVIVNFHGHAIRKVEVADLNNDGLNDIVSTNQSIVWNENLGNNIFSSHKLITNNIKTYDVDDVEVSDINFDGWLDIIGIVDGGLKIYKNIDGETFEEVYSLILDEAIHEIEIKDINNDNKVDILLSFKRGNVALSMILNNGAFNFDAITTIFSNTSTGYKAFNFKSEDVDGDNNNDIIMSVRGSIEVIFFKNDGSGNFTEQILDSTVPTDDIEIGDIDNDGDLDILASKSIGDGDLIWFKNINNYFKMYKIDTPTTHTISLGDLNNDGYLDVIGASVGDGSPYEEKTFYYLFKGVNFESKVVFETLNNTNSLERDSAIGDLNNDGKLDVITSYYGLRAVKYFTNTSIPLSIENKNLKVYKPLKVFPNPSSDTIQWDNGLNISKVSIYNTLGQLVFFNNEMKNQNKLSIEFLSKGLYFINANSFDSNYLAKFIIN